MMAHYNKQEAIALTAGDNEKGNSVGKMLGFYHMIIVTVFPLYRHSSICRQSSSRFS